MMRYICFLGILFSSLWVGAQRFQLVADSSVIRIGDPLTFTLSLQAPAKLNWRLISVKDSLGNMEVLSTSQLDTAFIKEDRLLTQKIVTSVYDSGSYTAGPCYAVNDRGDTLVSTVCDIKVLTLEVDTSKPFKDIYAPLPVAYTWQEFLPWIIGGLLLLAVFFYCALFLEKV